MDERTSSRPRAALQSIPSFGLLAHGEVLVRETGHRDSRMESELHIAGTPAQKTS